MHIVLCVPRALTCMHMVASNLGCHLSSSQGHIVAFYLGCHLSNSRQPVLSTAILSYLICHMLHIVQNLSYWALSNICHSMMEIPALLYILCYNFSRLCYQCSNMSKHCTYKSYMFKHCTFCSIIIQTSSNNQMPLQIHH
jgi:hypothetical protein